MYYHSSLTYASNIHFAINIGHGLRPPSPAKGSPIFCPALNNEIAFPGNAYTTSAFHVLLITFPPTGPGRRLPEPARPMI